MSGAIRISVQFLLAIDSVAWKLGLLLRVRPKTSRGRLLAAGGALLRQAHAPDHRPDTANSPSSPRLPGAAQPSHGPVLGRTLNLQAYFRGH